MDVWLACQHPKATTGLSQQVAQADAALRSARAAALNAQPRKSAVPDTITQNAVLDRARDVSEPDAGLIFLCQRLALPAGGTLARSEAVATWASAWAKPSPLPSTESVLKYAHEAEGAQRRVAALLDTIARLRGDDAGPPLTLAVYFAPKDTVIDRAVQGENLRRLVDAVRSIVEATRDTVVLEGRADYSGSDGRAAADTVNERIARARARALKLAILQSDNRIDESRLRTAVSVLDTADARLRAEVLLGGASVSGFPLMSKAEQKAVAAARAIDIERVLNGIRAGYRASGVRVSTTQLVAHAPAVSMEALTTPATANATPGVTPTQWAVALTNVIADRAVATAQAIAFSQAGHKLCDTGGSHGDLARRFRTTCGLVIPAGGQISDPSAWPTLDNVRSALRSDLAALTPVLVEELIDRSLPNAATLQEKSAAAARVADSVLHAIRAGCDKRACQRTRTVWIAARERASADSARAQLALRRAPELAMLQAVVHSAAALGRRLDDGVTPVEAIALLSEPLGVPAVDDAPLGRTLRQVASLVAEYADGQTTFVLGQIAEPARPDTLFLYAARALALSTRDTPPALHIVDLLNRGTRVVAAASALDSLLRAQGAAGEAAGTPAARFALAANRYAAYVRLVGMTLDGTPTGAAAARLDSLLTPTRDIVAAVAAGQHRAAFAQLARLAVLTAGDQSVLGPERRRVLGFAVAVAEAQDTKDADDAIRRFVGQGSGFRQKQYGERHVWPPLTLLNAYAGGVAQVGKVSGSWEGGWFMPVGMETGWRVVGARYLGVLAYPLDLGAFAALRASGKQVDEETQLKQVLSPGVALVAAPIKDVPLAFGSTLQWRTTTGTAGRRGRVSVFAAIDLPLFP